MSLTNEEKLLGITEEQKKKKLELLTEKTKYVVNTIGLNNQSTITGDILKSIISYEVQERIMEGEKELEYNGIEIKRADVQENKDFEAMGYYELKEYCQDKGIDIKGLKSKVDLIKAIKGE